MNTQPDATQTPTAAPAGQQWTWCMMLNAYEPFSCSAELRWDPSANFTQVRPQDIFDMYYRYQTPTTPQAGSWGLFFDAWKNVTTPPGPPPLAPARASEDTVVGLTVGLGAPLALALAALAALLLLGGCVRAGAGAGRPARPGAAWRPDASRAHDVFLSYRRTELQTADAVHDKLALAGLRVFYDRSGAMAGRPFEQELFRAIRDAPVFAPLITLADVQRWAAHAADAPPDFTLAEVIVALHFSRAGRVRLIFPLLVGEAVERPAAVGGGERDYLFANPLFKAARDALPAVVPAATLALVAAMFAAEGGGAALDAALATATVRDLILGAEGMHAAEAPAGAAEARSTELVSVSVQGAGAAVRGILEMDAVFLYGPDEQSGLVLRHRYAEAMVAALSDARSSK
jgi:hypothetical protein